MMYEPRQQRPLKRRQFAIRLAWHLASALGLIALSLLIGIAGYMGFEHLALLDALLNSAMLLGGMGPVDAPLTAGGKIFASCYALYAGLVFIVTAALLFTPVLHRLMHRFHWSEKL
jgi:hypothetical protein